MEILDKLSEGYDIKNLNIKDLEKLCAEIRATVIETVKRCGGHLSSNLGSVELTVALFYVFDFPKDRLIFDVGHQSYAYKILSGRLSRMETIRKKDGLSGFPDPTESEYDAFSVGHAGTSVAAGLGYCYSRDKLGEDYFVIDLVGDASMFNGENLEAISADNKKPRKFLVILNDNGMSIGKNNNGMYKIVSKITVTKRYNAFNDFLGRTIGKSFIGKWLRKFKKFLKRSMSPNTFVDGLGLKYAGIFDGHDLKTLIKVLKNVKESENPTLLHVKTIKGKGYKEAEENACKFHGVGKNFCESNNFFSDSVSGILNEIYLENDKITAITAGMKDGVGLSGFEKEHPDAVLDVGIAEEYAVTLAAGMAISGTRPIVFIYSTFLQRAYDQIVHDVCLQNLPVIFCIDRAGLVGSDGKTHQGVFDLSYLGHIPNLTIIAPKNTNELKAAIKVALEKGTPVAIRYPNGAHIEIKENNPLTSSLSWEVIKSGKKNVIFAVGARMISLAERVSEIENGKVTVINARVIKPLDFNILEKYKSDNIITLEENVTSGGFGAAVLKYYNDNGINAKVTVMGVKDKFISHASVNEQLEENGLTADDVLSALK